MMEARERAAAGGADVPDAVRRALFGQEGGSALPAGRWESVLAEATKALGSALAGRGERGGAFRLLAADALLTLACERALAEDDPRPALLRIVQEVVAGTEGR